MKVIKFQCVIQFQLKAMLHSQMHENYQEEKSQVLHLTMDVELLKPHVISSVIKIAQKKC